MQIRKNLLLLVCLFCAQIVFAKQWSFMYNDIEDQKIALDDVEKHFSNWFLIDDNYAFKKVTEREDELNCVHVNYKQYYQGVEVKDALVMVHSKNGVVYCVNGQIMQNDASKKNSLNVLKSYSENNIEPQYLYYSEKDDSYHWVKIVRDGDYNLYVDVQTNEILKKEPLFYNARSVDGKSYTMYSGLQDMTCYELDGVYYLADVERNIYTLSAKGKSFNYVLNNLTQLPLFYGGFSTFAKPTITRIRITSSTDWWGYTSVFDENPDFYIVIKNSANQVLYKSSVAKDMQLPFSFYPNVELDGEKITIEIYESDALSDDGPIAYYAVNYRESKTLSLTENITGTIYIDNTAPEYDAHWGMQKTFDYYNEVFGRKSYDGKGSYIYNVLYLSDQDQCNAFATLTEPYFMFYGLGGILPNGEKMKPLVSIDVMAHEYSHLVTRNNGNGGLDYEGESGALNESFSDIFGTCVEFYAKGENANWYIGEGLLEFHSNLRDMSDPKNGCDGDVLYAVAGYPQPDTYGGDYWQSVVSGGDNGGVHRNSGVQNYWFYLLCEGGQGTNDNNYSYDISPIGMNAAQKIAYRNLMNYLTPNATFRDACEGAIQSARDLFGKGSVQEQTVRDAWKAVGVTYSLKYSTLDYYINVADSLIENTHGQYDEEFYSKLQDALEDAQEFRNNEDNTQQEINKQITLLEIAITEYLNSKLCDKTELEKYINEADSLLKGAQIGTQPGQYGQRAYLNLQDELNAANVVNDKGNAKQDEIDLEVNQLKKAIDDFLDSKVPVDCSLLSKAIEEAKNLIENTQVGTQFGQYGQSEFLNLRNEIKVAESCMVSETLTQSDIDDECLKLLDVIDQYKKSQVGYTAIDTQKDEIIVEVKKGEVISNKPFRLYNIEGKEVSNQNGNLSIGVYMIEFESIVKKVLVE